jgi:MoaA/NifB/PqqE/SkfB family radical SAM enzyme
MLHRLRSLIPAALYGGHSAFPAVSKVASNLTRCSSADQAADIADRAKPELCARLRTSFGSPAAEALTLKILNLLLARYHFEARSVQVLSRPFGLVIDPSNVCRLACPGCVHFARSAELKLFDWPKSTLPVDCLSALLKRYGPYAIGALFCNYGEPLLNLNTPKLIRLAKTHLMGTAISTSLSVSRFDAEAYVASGLDYMGLSIDGATQPVYQQFRRNGDLELVLANIRKIVDAKRTSGTDTPVLGWNFLAFEHNVHEIPLALRMARKLGVDQFRVMNPFDVSRDDSNIRPAAINGSIEWLNWRSLIHRPSNWNPFPESVDGHAIIQTFEKPWSDTPAWNETPVWNGTPVASSPPNSGHTCQWLYKNMVMDAKGRIMPCCGAPRPDINLVFGTLDGNGSDPFNSEKYHQARAWFAGEGFARETPSSADAPHCTRCEWDHTTVNIGSVEIRRYFKAADAAFFDRRTLRTLSNW